LFCSRKLPNRNKQTGAVIIFSPEGEDSEGKESVKQFDQAKNERDSQEDKTLIGDCPQFLLLRKRIAYG